MSLVNYYFEKNNTCSICNENLRNVYSHENFNIKNYNIDNYTEPNICKEIPWTKELHEKYCGENRIKNNVDKYNKNPIVVLGCSYAYGHGLKEKESFPYLLSEYTQRPVYSFASCGSGLVSQVAHLNNDDIRNSDYVIYIYMYDHINRAIDEAIGTEIYFSKNKLLRKLMKIKLIYCILVRFKINNIMKNYPYESQESRDFIKTIISYSNNIIKKYAPNAKYIIIFYDEKIKNDHTDTYINWVLENQYSNIWNEIAEEQDITIVRTKDIMGFLFDKEYKLKEDIAPWHPNERAWIEFTPLFAKKYIKD